MAPRTPDEGKAREIIRSTRLSPEDDAAMARRRGELGQSVSTYLRALVRADVKAHPSKGARRG